MSDELSFSEILDLPLDSIKEPALIPMGTYRAVLGQYRADKTKGEKQTPFVEFPCTLIEPEGDVDQESFEEYGGLAKLSKAKLRLTYYLTEDSRWRAKEFIERTLGLSGAEAASLKLGFQAGVGAEILVTIGHRPDQKTQKPRAEITATAPLP